MNLYNRWFILNYTIYEKLIESTIVIFTILLIVFFIKEKNNEQSYINLIWICLGNIMNLVMLMMQGDIFWIIPLISTGLFLIYFYDKGIDQINEYELKGISYKSSEREKLSREYDSVHSTEELKNIKKMAKEFDRYRLGKIKIAAAIYTVPIIIFIIQLIV